MGINIKPYDYSLRAQVKAPLSTSVIHNRTSCYSWCRISGNRILQPYASLLLNASQEPQYSGRPDSWSCLWLTSGPRSTTARCGAQTPSREPRTKRVLVLTWLLSDLQEQLGTIEKSCCASILSGCGAGLLNEDE